MSALRYKGIKSLTEGGLMKEVEILGESKDVCLSPALVNGIVAAYQIAVTKALGAGANALSQILLQELGDLLSSYVEQIVEDVDFTKPEEAIRKVFEELKLAEKVEVERGDNEWLIKIKGSVFIPTYKILRERNVEFFTLSPEALIVASIIRKYLRLKGTGKERVAVKAEVPEDDVLVFKVREIKSLR
jgi:hypothetical protein